MYQYLIFKIRTAQQLQLFFFFMVGREEGSSVIIESCFIKDNEVVFKIRKFIDRIYF